MPAPDSLSPDKPKVARMDAEKATPRTGGAQASAAQVSAVEASPPSALERLLVVVAALMALFTPYLVTVGSTAVGNELVGDGLVLVARHPVLTAVPSEPAALLEAFSSDWWGDLQPGTKFYRPIPTFLLGVGALVASTGQDWAYDPRDPKSSALPFKLLAVAAKIVCALLVVEFAFVLLRQRRTAFVAGLLFAVLPVHGASVLDVAGIATTTATAFMLGAWILWLRAGDRPLARPAALAGAAICTLLAALSMETAFLLPLVFLAVDAGRSSATSLVGGLKQALGKLGGHAVLVGALLVALGLRFAATGQLLPEYLPGSEVENPLIGADILTRLMDGLRLSIGGLLATIGIMPFSSNFGFSADYSYPQVQVGAAFAWQNIVAALGWVGALVGVAVLYKRCRTRAGLLLGALVACLACAQVVAPYRDVFNERLVFFASAIVAVLLATLVVPLAGRLGKAGLGAVAAVVVVLIGLDVVRAKHYATDQDLWTHTTRHTAPYSSRAHFNLGRALLSNDFPSTAASAFRRATDPRDTGTPLAHSWALAMQAVAYLSNGDDEQAIEPLRAAVEIQIAREGGVWARSKWDAYAREDRMDVLLWKLTETETAGQGLDPEGHLAYLDGLLARGYSSPYVYLYRGDTLRKLDRLAEAEAAYAQGIAIAPLFSLIRTYGRTLRQTGRNAEAEQLYADQIARSDGDISSSQRLEYLLLAADLAYTNGDRATASQRVEEILGADPSGSVLFRALNLKSTLLLDQKPAGSTPAEQQIDLFKRLDEVARLLRRAVATWAVQNDDVTLQVWQTYSGTLVELGRYRAAANFLRSIIGVADTPTLRLRLGECLYWLAEDLNWTGPNALAARQHLGVAAARFRELMMEPGLTPDKQLYLANTFYKPARLLEIRSTLKLGQPDEYEEQVRNELTRSVDEVGALIVRAHLEIERGQYADARATFESLVVRAPANEGEWKFRTEGITVLEQRLVDIGSNPSAEAMRHCAFIQLTLENLDGAQVALAQAIELAQSDRVELARCRELASRILLRTRGPNQAIEQLDAAILALDGADPGYLRVLEEQRSVLRSMLGTAAVGENL